MVQNYTADLKHALWSLQSTGSLPPFPKSEWKHVLSGTVVNLDAVFLGLFSTLMDDKVTTSIRISISQLEVVNCPRLFKPTETGPLPGMLSAQPSSVISLTAPARCDNIQSIYFSFLEPFRFLTGKSSTLTKPSATMLVRSNTSSCPRLNVSGISKPATYRTTGQVTMQTPLKRKRSPDQTANPTRPAASGTTEFVTGKLLNANIDTCAQFVEKSTLKRNVRRRIESSKEYMHPRYA
jgi:hypothetical protein